jgi:hypothetical protein
MDAIHAGKGQKADAAWIKKMDEIYTYWGSAWAAIGLLRTLPPGATADGAGAPVRRYQSGVEPPHSTG